VSRANDRPEGPESFSADDTPPTQPEGALVPPPRKPGWQHRTRFAQFVTEIFNAIDGVADRIAERLGLRQ